MDAVTVATSGLLRDAVEFIHAAVHVAGRERLAGFLIFHGDLYGFYSEFMGFIVIYGDLE